MKEKKKPKKSQRVSRKPARLVVEREFVGSQSATDALLPVVLEDLLRHAEEVRTFDKEDDST
ncbi:stage II sporulation protein R [Cohnella xylanilytica]|uniref:Stage II sporulation protein R n=1 Tax=Cohnella xylanilytica TaxID=557555 RepID=A0A841TXA7_9BACL|nr:stage II sporulation protein R [Cohnella xylanilytica]MBB6690773.1 stage II sporulation protein R [Cohnella xylanilytica]